MPKRTWLTTNDRDALRSYVETDDLAGIVEVLSEYGYTILDDEDGDETAAQEWLERRGWTCRTED